MSQTPGRKRRRVALAAIGLVLSLALGCGSKRAEAWHGVATPPGARGVRTRGTLPSIDELSFAVDRPCRDDEVYEFYVGTLGPEWRPCTRNRSWWVTRQDGRAIVCERKSQWFDARGRRRLVLRTGCRAPRGTLSGTETQSVGLTHTTFGTAEAWDRWFGDFCKTGGRHRRSVQGRDDLTP